MRLSTAFIRGAGSWPAHPMCLCPEGTLRTGVWGSLLDNREDITLGPLRLGSFLGARCAGPWGQVRCILAAR